MAVPAEKPRKKSLEERRAEVETEREQMREKAIGNRQQASEAKEETVPIRLMQTHTICRML